MTTWYNLKSLHLFWLLPILLILFLYAAHKRKKALQLFTGTVLLKKLTANFSRKKRTFKILLFLLAIVFLIIAMARPAWNLVPQDVKREGRDVVFLLDVSRSMLAEDLKPNRLERAKLAIYDCLEVLQGDRVALAVFAGNTVIRCPLTQDYGFFRMMLADVSTDSVSRGGTLIGDALRKVSRELFDQQERQYKDIILITDGEDHESFPLEAAKSIGDAGIRLIAVGLGDEAGTPIIITDERGQRNVVKYKGETVRSSLDSNTLRKMVNATPGGRYLPVATGNIDLDQVYLKLIAGAEKREIDSQTLERYEEKFQIFLAIALLLLALESLISERKLQRKLLLLLLFAASISQATTAKKSLRSGNKAFQKEQYAEALDFYQKAAIDEPDSATLLYNQGLVFYKQEELDKAQEFFEKALGKILQQNPPDKKLAALLHLSLGNSQFKEYQKHKEGNLQKAIEACEKSILHYKDALRFNKKLEAAKENLFIASLTLKKLLSELKELLKQQQEMQEQMQKQAEKLQELSEEQKKAAQESGEANENNDQSQEKAEQLSEQQKKISKETDELTEEIPDDSAAKEKLQEAQKEQKEAAEKLKEKDYKAAEEKQQEAAKKLQEAQEELQKEIEKQEQQQNGQQSQEEENSEENKQSGQPDEENNPQEEENADSSETEGEGDEEGEQESFNLIEDAKDILDEELKNKKLRQINKPANIKAVEKDW